MKEVIDLRIKSVWKGILPLGVTLLGVTFLTFLLSYMAPGDPATLLLTSGGQQIVSPELLQEVRHEMGLDRPFLVQYGLWLWHALQGDLGMSYSSHEPVVRVLWDGFRGTIWLALGAVFVQMVISLPLGIYSAVYHNEWQDYISRIYSFLVISMPSFVLGLLLLYIVGVRWGILPIARPIVSMETVILPSITLGITMSAKFTRQVRTTIMEEIHKDYVMGAKARGLSQRRILWKYVLPNACMPLITVLGMSLGWLLGGVALIETVFTYPGVGRLVVQAISMRDYPVIVGFVLASAAIYMLINWLVDLSYFLLDPRRRRREGQL